MLSLSRTTNLPASRMMNGPSDRLPNENILMCYMLVDNTKLITGIINDLVLCRISQQILLEILKRNK